MYYKRCFQLDAWFFLKLAPPYIQAAVRYCYPGIRAAKANVVAFNVTEGEAAEFPAARVYDALQVGPGGGLCMPFGLCPLD